jgi:penicillin-binding protein 1B
MASPRKKSSKKKTTRKKTSKKKLSRKKTGVRKTRSVKRKQPSRKKAGRSRKRLFGLLKWFFGLMLLFTMLIGGYSLYLSQIVRVKFEGKRWAVPARVYARPLELYVGAPIQPDQLQAELQALGYRKEKYPKSPAQWSRAANRFALYGRDFQFWDGAEPGQLVRVEFDDNGISALAGAGNKQALDLMRMEPPLIGSIYPSHKEDRVLIRRDEMPDHLVNALLAAEDRQYFQHHGVSPLSILRALAANVQAGRTVQGGSTLTQQLVKNFFLTPERSMKRKLDEALMAIILEMRYNKDEIMEAYANEVFLGQDGARAIHGFGLASYYYFNRPVNELEVQESALLVGLLKGASHYNPRQHPERSLKRRNLILLLMAEQGFISDAEFKIASKASLGVTAKGRKTSVSHPAFIDLVRRQLLTDYREEDLTSEGLRVFTTMDPWIQRVAEQGVSSGLTRLEKGKRVARGLEAALVLVSPQGGEIRALVGGRDSQYAGFNRALDAVRPIGSLIKPVLYLLALAQPDKHTLVSMLEDKAIQVKGKNGQVWAPKNYDRKERGLVQLHTALAKSLNLATVHLGLSVGVDKLVALISDMGVAREIKPFPSLFLGAAAMSPLDVAQIYQVLAAEGFKSPLRAIREVTDAEGVALQRYGLEVERVMDPGPVYLLNRNLVEVMREGTGRGITRYLPAGFEVAGKTGTTDELRDSWFAGFTGDLLAVVWVGRDNNKPSGLTGSSGALKIWGQVMKDLKPMPLSLIPPDDVNWLWVESSTGFLSDSNCPGALAMPFIKGSQPSVQAACGVESSGGNFLHRWSD